MTELKLYRNIGNGEITVAFLRKDRNFVHIVAQYQEYPPSLTELNAHFAECEVCTNHEMLPGEVNQFIRREDG